MLQKGFFYAEPFNPNPYWDNTILNLSGASKFESDTIFKAGRYRIDIQAGGGTNDDIFGGPAKITQDIVVEQDFIIRAYCGSAGTTSAAGINPYSGEFKVNASFDFPTTVNHIFGNKGGVVITQVLGAYFYFSGSGNCLGDGIQSVPSNYTSGAGSCLHIMPIGGTFGTDYLFAFHTTSSGTGYLNNNGTINTNCGAGGAYGGGAGWIFGANEGRSGGSTPYGTGGGRNQDGTGIGAGLIGKNVGGAGAWFDGTQWNDSRTLGDPKSTGHIVITWLGNLI